MITIFSCPKPFTDPRVARIQRAAIGSWLALDPRLEIILVGSDVGVDETATVLGLRHIPTVAKNKFGTPLVSSIFAQAEGMASHQVIAYVNCDIVLFDNFIKAVRIASKIEKFLLTGQRTDLVIDRDLVPPENEQDVEGMLSFIDTLRVAALTNGRLHGPSGVDYFVYRKGLWPKIPEFALGRFAWDQWLVWSALARRARVIDATEDVLAIHQNHDYSHSIVNDRMELWHGEEAVHNRELATGQAMDILDASHVLKAGRIGVARNAVHIERRLQRLYTEQPWIAKVKLPWKMKWLYAWANVYAGV